MLVKVLSSDLTCAVSVTTCSQVLYITTGEFLALPGE